jgi:hypothetical protein
MLFAEPNWISGQQAKEDYLTSIYGSVDYPYFYSFPGVDIPRNGDVLLGRGKSLQNHPGNVRMRHYCESMWPLHIAATKRERQELHA